jgi:maleylpyruvate isomerase
MILDAPDNSAEERLRARLGAGARQDAAGAPADALRLARHGLAFFARHLNALTDQDLGMPSRVPGWRRAHVVAHVSLSARAQALALAALRGQPPEDEFDWTPDIDLAASLPARALRHLFDHAHVHVNVEWRDLSSAQWDQTVSLGPTDVATARDLPAQHAGLLWWSAVALNAAATEDEIPRGVDLPRGPLQAMATGAAHSMPARAGTSTRPEH